MDYKIEELNKFEDERGFLIEFLKNSEMSGDQKTFGQIYLATIKPGCFRGNHYHKHKVEFFAVMIGKVSIILEDINTKERKELEIDAAGKKVVRVRVGPNVAHSIKNNSDQEIVLCAYSNEEYYSKSLDQEVYKLI